MAVSKPKHLQIITDAITEFMTSQDGVLIINLPPLHGLTTTLVELCAPSGPLCDAGYVAAHRDLAARESARYNGALTIFAIEDFRRRFVRKINCDVLLFDIVLTFRPYAVDLVGLMRNALDATSAKKCVVAGPRSGIGDIFDQVSSGAIRFLAGETLCLPGEYDPDHPMRSTRDFRTITGDVLWPERVNLDAMSTWKRQMGPSKFSWLVNQRKPERFDGFGLLYQGDAHG